VKILKVRQGKHVKTSSGVGAYIFHHLISQLELFVQLALLFLRLTFLDSGLVLNLVILAVGLFLRFLGVNSVEAAL